MLLSVGYLLLTMLLVTESLVMTIVLRGTLRAAIEHQLRRSTPIGLVPAYRSDSTLSDDFNGDARRTATVGIGGSWRH